MQAETSATPLLTEDKTSSLLRQDCPFHSVSTLDCCHVQCPEKMFYVLQMERGDQSKRVTLACHIPGNLS